MSGPSVPMDEFDYRLPRAAIAQQPIEPRDAARLLVATATAVAHRHVRDLPQLIRPGDVVVLNDTKVLPARLLLRKATGGRSEVLLLEPRPGGTWEALVRPSRRVTSGTEVRSDDGSVVVLVGEDLGEGRREVALRVDGRPVVDAAAASEALAGRGLMPLPPYITRTLDRPDRYQTVFADRAGSVAAPTAGLHLTQRVLDGIAAAGAIVAKVELVVGLDTFRPVTVDDPANHVMHSEAYRVPTSTWEACQSADRVVAVGTTVVRALESVAVRGELAGRTDLFIRRPWRFEVVQCLLTNFHLPRSTLLCLVDAFAGPRWRALYQEALDSDYRFLSFGDAMWLDPGGP